MSTGAFVTVYNLSSKVVVLSYPTVENVRIHDQGSEIDPIKGEVAPGSNLPSDRDSTYIESTNSIASAQIDVKATPQDAVQDVYAKCTLWENNRTWSTNPDQNWSHPDAGISVRAKVENNAKGGVVVPNQYRIRIVVEDA